MDKNSYEKPYILSILDNEVINTTKKNIEKIENDFYLMSLISYGYPLLPLTVLFENNVNRPLLNCITEMLKEHELILMSKYTEIYDFATEQQQSFSSKGRFSLLHNKTYQDYITEITPIIQSKNMSTTKYIEEEMINEGFYPIIQKSKKSKIYNINSVIYPAIDHLTNILKNRKDNAIVESTFLPILDENKINKNYRKYLFKSVTTYNNDLYYRNYSRLYDAVIPVGTLSLINSHSNIEEMNFDKFYYKSPANNLRFWRKIFHGLNIKISNCKLIILLRKTPVFIEQITKIKELLEEKMPYDGILDTTHLNIYNYINFPVMTYIIAIDTVESIIEKLSLLISMNTINIEKDVTIKEKGMTMNVNIENSYGDVLGDSAVKNIQINYNNEQSKEIIDSLAHLIKTIKSSNIDNKDLLVENINNFTNEPSKLKNYLTSISSIASIESAVLNTIKFFEKLPPM